MGVGHGRVMATIRVVKGECIVMLVVMLSSSLSPSLSLSLILYLSLPRPPLAPPGTEMRDDTATSQGRGP